jgi:hypothetical protein
MSCTQVTLPWFDALVAGQIDIAWNTPLAYLQAKERLGGQCLVLGMRDSDVGFTTVFITCTDSPIHSLSDLKDSGSHWVAATRLMRRYCRSTFCAKAASTRRRM